MNLSLILMQVVQPENHAMKESYFELLMKGGWVLVPIIFLQILAIYVIVERWLVLNEAKSKDNMWISHIKELIQDRKIDKAVIFCAGMKSSSARVIAAGLNDMENDVAEIENELQMEARQEINRLESKMNYLGITAAIAPMLGFLGTIFGVIKIFYNISVTNDLNIANISDGLYQKMICSGVGLLVGIIAYVGYYTLNGRIDNIVVQIEKDSNEVLKYIKQFKKQKDN